MRALVADDEPLARKRLTRLLEDRGVEVVAQAATGPDAVRLIRQEAPDVAFLDIEMPVADGLSVVREIGIEDVPRVVFVTAHNRYAIDAFDVHAADFLLKPFDKARLDGTLAHLHRMSGHEDADGTWRARLQELLHSARAVDYACRLLVKEGDEASFVSVGDIEYIEADGYHIHIHTKTQDHLVRRSLAELEAELDPQHFLRIHRSIIVNLDTVAKLVQWFSGGYLVRLKSGRELTLSRRYATKLFDRVGTTL